MATCESCGDEYRESIVIRDWEGVKHRVCGECYDVLMEKYEGKPDPMEFGYFDDDGDAYPWEWEQPRELRFE